ncbi:hypothetical protein [Streptomyces sp. ms184]|uniref:hypothetical protein n=1 Tax=Streptomyces sp. ms184 TaxID=1827974 RepID=UPI00117E424A|nr:hypothetical protein [Streptomyces sp. ms184]
MDKTFYGELLATDLTALDGLAVRWKSIHGSIKGLTKRMHDEVLVPLRNKGYWEGAAAPYAWKMIDLRLEDDRRHRAPIGVRGQGGRLVAQSYR